MRSGGYFFFQLPLSSSVPIAIPRPAMRPLSPLLDAAGATAAGQQGRGGRGARVGRGRSAAGGGRRGSGSGAANKPSSEDPAAAEARLRGAVSFLLQEAAQGPGQGQHWPLSTSARYAQPSSTADSVGRMRTTVLRLPSDKDGPSAAAPIAIARPAQADRSDRGVSLLSSSLRSRGASVPL
jgi:hypothetical protein